jgi:shikimate 5-dehydrogenase
MFQMDIKNIYLFNRTKAKAGVIALDFSEFFKITVLDSLDDLLTPGFVAPDVIIGTIPADKTTIASFPKILWANPEGICVDMSYKPRLTPLLECTMKYRESENGWSTVTGIEVLLEQAFDQFRLWTGREAPKEEMKRAVLEKRDGQVLVFEAQGRALI